MKSYNKLTWREILSSKARFLSILIIILLGVAFYAGIRSTGPDMNEAINEFYGDYKLMDNKIVSNLGIWDKDVDIIKNDEKILDFYASKSIDVNLINMNNVVKFMEYNTTDENAINQFVVIDGKLPVKSGEIALDEEALKYNKNLKIGDEFIIDSDENTLKSFKQTKFKIVGFLRNPMYIEKGSRGITSIGKGSVDYFAALNSTDIALPSYTELYVRFKNVQGMDGYSKEYENLMKKNTEYLEELYKSQDTDVAKYHVFDRTDNPGYLGYKDAINSLDKIASVLPVFFFLLAAMICLTTMTRMVEENRVEIGTLKALGYGNFQISKKYIIYASLASISGSALGILLGCNIIPKIIINAYESLYSLPKLNVYYYPSFILQSVLISILCTVVASFLVIILELRNKPSELMKVRAPKLGKKILLERLTPLWSRLSFNYKVTLRNIFRYKQRMFMTIVGISGCMAILLTGFGLKDSNEGVVERQFKNLWKYEAMVILNNDSTQSEKNRYNDILNELPGYQNNLNLHQEAVIFSKEGMNTQEATLYVAESPKILGDFINLNHRKTGEQYTLSHDGAIITEKLAKLLGVSSGSTVTVTDDKNNTYEVKISRVAENYLQHYIYFSPTYYENVFGKKPVYNTQLLNLDMTKIDNEDDISSKLLDAKNVLNVALMSHMQKTTEESTANMNLVMIVIIISAGCLAFVVLYNLNNINVSERIRELSTIKVLGFYDNEVTMYILRENIILTLLGILLGSALGKMLHSFIIYTSETDALMMYPRVSHMSYFLSSLITIVFSIIVMIIMHIKLQRVNMIDALKSNE